MQSRVPIVEDEPDLAELVRFHLTQAGFASEVAHSGRAGLEAIRRARPALVVLDLKLTDLSGTDVWREDRGAGQPGQPGRGQPDPARSTPRVRARRRQR